MHFKHDGKSVYASTGGRESIDGRPWIIFMHGAGQSHLTWSQQGRALAYDDYNVLAPDLPGHGDSEGPVLEGVAQMSDWYIGVMDTLGIQKAHLVNHSMGGLISLELAKKHADRVASVTFIATAMSIAVNDHLIDMAKNDQEKAIAFMTAYSSGAYSHAHDNSVPGASLIGTGVRIMQHNPHEALVADLTSCAAYQGGAEAAAAVQCPTLCLLAENDLMVQTRYGKKLAEALPNNRVEILPEAGHSLTVEKPREVNALLREFLGDIG